MIINAVRQEEWKMTNCTMHVIKSVSCPELTVKAVLSYGFANAVRFFSALRFYFYSFFTPLQTV